MKYEINLSKQIFLFFILIIIIDQSLEDLPIHCLKHQIVGEWLIKATELFHVKSGHEMKCGHEEPSSEESAYIAKPNISFINEYDLNLKNDNTAIIRIKGVEYKGKWTMVYDEGFDVIFENFSFFAFSKYSIENDNENNIIKYKSFCYLTCVGWYKNKDKTKVGCYSAEKKNTNKDTVLFFNTRKLDMKKELTSYKEPIKFMQRLRSNVRVEDLNKIKKNWIAIEYPEFANKTLLELNKLAGININKKSKISTEIKTKYSFRFKYTQTQFKSLPENFDWKNKVRLAGNQGKCGSCYAWSTMRMLESRIKILYDHNVNLSVQHALDCSYYNQGCLGGYSYLVLKFGNEFDLLPESCYPYNALVGKCSNNCHEKVKFKVGSYHYLGGSYGKCTEELMMEELRNNGPFVVSIEPDYSFMFYKSGIYHSIDKSSWIGQGLTKPEWQKVDHSVLLVGWGVDFDTKEKYWLIQNSWGNEWGENGYFRIRRGVDELSVESICEVGTPILLLI